MLPTKCWFIWESGFRGEYFFTNRPTRNKNCMWRPCLLTDQDEMSNQYRGPSMDASYEVSVHWTKRFQRRIFSWNRPVRNKNFPCQSCLLTNRDEMSNLYIGTSKGASYQMFFHLGKRFQRRSLSRNRPTGNKNCLWRPCLLTDHDEISNLYRGSSIDVSYQVLFHFGMRFQRRRLFRNQPIRNKNYLWRPCLLTDHDEMSNLYREPS
jgi:hypothetical protein